MIEDIYGDLDNFDVGQSINELEIKNKALTEQLDHLTKSLDIVTKEVDEVKRINKQLQENISKLFNTAKTELERKSNMIADLRKQLDDLLFRKTKPANYKIPKKRKMNENVIENADDTKKPKLDDEVKSLDKENTESKEKSTEYKRSHSPKSSIRYNSRNNKYNRRSRERSPNRKHYRSRSRSRDRNRRTPPRDHHRGRRDRRNRSRDNSRERRRSPDRRNHSPNRRNHSPDRRNHSPDKRTHSPNRRYHSPDNEQRPYDADRKSYVENFKKRELERNSDSESVISIKSTSSHEDVTLVSDRKDKKNLKNVKQTIIKTKGSQDSEIEEGEISDDGSEATVELKAKNTEKNKQDKDKEKDRNERKSPEKNRESEKHNKEEEKSKDKRDTDSNDSNKNQDEKDNLRKIENKSEQLKSVLENHENETSTKNPSEFQINKFNQPTNEKEKPLIKGEKSEEQKKTHDQENIENNQQNKGYSRKECLLETKEKIDRIKNKQLLLFGNDSSIDFESTLMGYPNKSELDDIQKFIEDQLQEESDNNDTSKLTQINVLPSESVTEDKNTPQINFKFESPKKKSTEQLDTSTNPLDYTNLQSSTPNTFVEKEFLQKSIGELSVPLNLTTQPRNLSEMAVNTNTLSIAKNENSLTNSTSTNSLPSNLPQKKPVRRRRCILTIQ